MTTVDDSSNVLLITAFGTLAATGFQLSGVLEPRWTKWTISIFLAGIALQLLNYIGSGVLGITTPYSVLIAMFVAVNVLYWLLSAVETTATTTGVIGCMAFFLIYLQPLLTSWLLSETGVDFPPWSYLIVLVFVLGGLYLLGERAMKWPWFGRVCNLVFLSFMAAMAELVIYRRDIAGGFDVTQFVMLDFDTWFWVSWAVNFVIDSSIYALFYTKCSFHRDRRLDEKEDVWNKHRKQQKTDKKQKKDKDKDKDKDEHEHEHEHHNHKHDHQHQQKHTEWSPPPHSGVEEDDTPLLTSSRVSTLPLTLRDQLFPEYPA